MGRGLVSTSISRDDVTLAQKRFIYLHCTIHLSLNGDLLTYSLYVVLISYTIIINLSVLAQLLVYVNISMVQYCTIHCCVEQWQKCCEAMHDKTFTLSEAAKASLLHYCYIVFIEV